jgi:N6-adenosine-specific RNA methylase IME4
MPLDTTPQPQALFSSDAFAKRIKEDIAAGDKANAHAEAHYRAAGAKLITLKEHKPTNVTWDTYVKKMVGIAQVRANELIRMAKGETTLAELRAKNAARQQKFRENQTLRNVVSDGEIVAAAKETRAQRIRERKEKTNQRILKSTQAPSSLKTIRIRYPLILADPPWSFKAAKCGGFGFGNHSPENHYPTMTLEQIRSLPVKDIATDDAALFLWSTNAHLQEALEVMQSWGFRYTASLIWMKDVVGMGFYFRNQHELLLLGLKGEMPAPHPENRPPSVLEAPRTGHSEKPKEVYRLIERMYPDFARMELFARSQHPGWDRWGNHKLA